MTALIERRAIGPLSTTIGIRASLSTSLGRPTSQLRVRSSNDREFSQVDRRFLLRIIICIVHVYAYKLKPFSTPFIGSCSVVRKRLIHEASVYLFRECSHSIEVQQYRR